MKVLRILTAIAAMALSSCGFDTRHDIPAGHPRTVVLTRDLPLSRSALRDRLQGSEIEIPDKPPLDLVKRGTRITFDALLDQNLTIAPSSYLLCHTEEKTPRVFEYYVGDRGSFVYVFPPPWKLPAGHSFRIAIDDLTKRQAP